MLFAENKVKILKFVAKNIASTVTVWKVIRKEGLGTYAIFLSYKTMGWKKIATKKESWLSFLALSSRNPRKSTNKYKLIVEHISTGKVFSHFRRNKVIPRQKMDFQSLKAKIDWNLRVLSYESEKVGRFY